ncbi:MAG: CTP synthase [Bdellovibrionales bacterium]|nr:CTP synthase [Bdellovibrionales bacterium]
MATKKAKSLTTKKKAMQPKFIFVTGGVVSSIGKGLTAASLGTLLESRGLKVNLMKCDPYINVDPGTMSPLQHGEVYVTDDGAETDLDLGHYERFTNVTLTKSHSTTAGQVYESVISKERRGDYLGGTVQVIPHITDEIKARILQASQGAEVTIVEIGGTIGDIEGLPFIEAIRQLRVDLGEANSLFLHVTYIPFIAAAGELKSKPTQHSVKELRAVGIQPDILVCRSEKKLNKEIKSKIGLFCSVKPEYVIAATDSSTIYEVPLNLQKEGVDDLVVKALGLRTKAPDLTEWKRVVRIVKKPKKETTIGIVGKYVDLKESYKSLHESLVHAGIANNCKVNIEYIDAEKITPKSVRALLKKVNGILVPGGFGSRGADGKILAIKYARENKVPFFGICFGMQMAAVEFARNVCGIKSASSREFEKRGSKKNFNYVIDVMEDQKTLKNKGGTMRLGAYPCHLSAGSKVKKIYQKTVISERHRHRFEFNNQYKDLFVKNGMSLPGVCKERDLVEILEISAHPWFIGVQYHPEFKSKPMKSHPLFKSFVKATIKK